MVLGDMGELGDDGRQLHAAIGTQAAAQGIDAVFTLGQLSAATSAAFGQPQHHFVELDALLAALTPTLTPETTVLVKGSRSARMERVVEALIVTTKELA